MRDDVVYNSLELVQKSDGKKNITLNHNYVSLNRGKKTTNSTTQSSQSMEGVKPPYDREKNRSILDEN